MKLQTKISVMFWVYTSLIFFQTLFAVLAGAISHMFSKDWAEGYFDIARTLVKWRNDKIYWYAVNTKRGYSLDIE